MNNKKKITMDTERWNFSITEVVNREALNKMPDIYEQAKSILLMKLAKKIEPFVEFTTEHERGSSYIKASLKAEFIKKLTK